MAQDTAHATPHTGQAHRRTGVRWRMAPHTQHNTPGEHTGEQAPSGPGHHARNEKPTANTAANSRQVGQHTAHATQHSERTHRSTGAKWPRTPRMQQNALSEHTGEQEPSAPGHRTRNTTLRARTFVNRSQVAQDTAQATQHTERAHRWTGAKWPRTPRTQHNAPSEHTAD